TPDGKRALSGGAGDYQMRLWDIETGMELRRFEGHTRIVTHVDIARDGKRAVSASDDKTMRLWDLDTGRQLLAYEGHTAVVTSVVFSPDGRTILSASVDKTVRLWPVPK